MIQRIAQKLAYAIELRDWRLVEECYRLLDSQTPKTPRIEPIKHPHGYISLESA